MGRIKFLEIQNFRSYRGKHLVGPFSRFSAIIGPNGGGKSNLLDSLAFVLGVRSTQLRSSNLSDLRYNPPRGKNYNADAKSYVKIVYSETDYAPQGKEGEDVDIVGEDIVFYRAILKNNSTEYRLNGSTVTWEEYEKKMTSINVLVKARNFIIFQGDMVALGRKTEKELTRMLETISGSGELKREYDDLRMKKDAADEQKLYSIMKRRGIAAEKKQFKEQKAEALRFKELLEKKESLYREQFLFELFHFNQAKVDQFRKIEAINEKIREEKESIDVLNASVLEKRGEKARKHKESLVMSRKVQNLKSKIEKMRPLKYRLSEQKSNIEFSLANKEKLKEKLQQEKEKHGSAVSEIEKSLQKSNTALAEIENHGEELGSGDIAADGETMKEYTHLKSVVSSETREFREQLDECIPARRSTEAALEDVSRKMKELKLQKEQFTSNLSNLGQRQEGIELGISEISSNEEEVSEELKEHKEKARTLNAKRKQASEMLDSTLTKLRQMKSDKSQAQRYARSQEVVSSLRRLFPKVLGRLVDICIPVHKKYDVGLTVALGKFAEAVVVQDKFTAMECVKYLRDQKLGVYTFLPIDTLKVRNVDVDQLRMVEDATLMLDVVKYDPGITKAVRFVLQDTLLASDLVTARRVKYGSGRRIKVVTMDGCILRKSGLITGGRGGVTLKATSRWDDQRIEDLRAAKDDFMAKYSKTSEELRRLPLESELKEKLTRAETSKRHMNLDLKLVEDRIAKTSADLQSISQELDELAKKESEGLKAIRVEKERQEKIEARIARAESKVFKDFCKRLGINRVGTYEERVINVNVESMRKRRRLVQQIERMKNEIAYEKRSTFEDRVEFLDKEMERDIEKIVEMQGEGDELDKKLKEVQNQLNSTHTKYLGMIEEEDSRTKEVRGLNDRVKTKDSRFNSLNKDLSVCEVTLDQIRAKCASIIRQCKVEGVPLPYTSARDHSPPGSGSDSPQSFSKSFGTSELTLDSDKRLSLMERDEEMQIDYSIMPRKLRNPMQEREVEAQKRKYEKEYNDLCSELGKMDPNLKSIEKLDDVKGRLKVVNEDLDNVLREAMQVETEFDSIAKERAKLFKKAFNTVSLNIGRIYEEMTASDDSFNKGHAHLSLENPRNPYDGMVFYHPNPPQKQNAGLETLSDGEKAVAILSLLFAFHKVRQAPFFLLDEIDESLDAVNVKKVARYFKEASRRGTQVICISHKADFYSESDVLIGVVKDRKEDTSKVFTFSLANERKEAMEMAEGLGLEGYE